MEIKNVYSVIFTLCFLPVMAYSTVLGTGSLDLTPTSIPLRQYDQSIKTVFELPEHIGWWYPNLGTNKGFWDISVGFHLWHHKLTLGDDNGEDRFILRNLQWRNSHYLAPGLRVTNVLRASRNYEHLNPIELFVDESFIEQLGYYQNHNHNFSYSLKLGRMRYLRFPYPDLISMYDQVPDIMDLDGLRTPPKSYSGYQGTLFTSEYHYNGFGVHYTGIQWMDSVRHGGNTIEQYMFLRKEFGLSLEARWGILANRFQKNNFYLGSGSPGYSIHLGKNIKGYHIGFLYEYLEDEGIRTGILVEFTPNKVNKALGKWRVDYTRSPQGIGLQPTLYESHYGFSKKKHDEVDLVGVILVERTTTYWQNGQGRNFYEHIVYKNGHTDPTLYDVAIKEGPIYLRIESLVSPHNKFHSYDDLIEWEKSRQGPAQIARLIEYRFYKKH